MKCDNVGPIPQFHIRRTDMPMVRRQQQADEKLFQGGA